MLEFAKMMMPEIESSQAVPVTILQLSETQYQYLTRLEMMKIYTRLTSLEETRSRRPSIAARRPSLVGNKNAMSDADKGLELEAQQILVDSMSQ